MKSDTLQVALIQEDPERGLVMQSFNVLTRAELEGIAAWWQTIAAVEDDIERARR